MYGLHKGKKEKEMSGAVGDCLGQTPAVVKGC